ncbi:MAG: DNA polymerase III subunit gamma/tau, partial [Peptoniphilaceae bacterium]|nr:DNA polymerase III subunit gamma/tau [Peptoniphilaceae bacterium]
MKKALYRAYRPQTFDAVLGQDHITRVLKNQVQSRTPAHAYLFAGTRGTGKTSCAKILARAVNCLHPVNGNPCNECENCRAILEETTMDVVEMDAASNRRIDDIRELRDNVIYPPTLLKYKVYIIDEAHMITNEGFNALLKIMEEPPEHLIFILATTEMERIPVTILSRTQRYEFKRLELADIEKEVQYVAGEVGLDIYPDALHSIAIAADGAMRDALSLLDQVLASGKTTITQEIVDAVLGTVGYRSLTTLTQAVLADDLPAAFQQVEALLQNGKDAHILLKEWLEYWRLLLLIK